MEAASNTEQAVGRLSRGLVANNRIQTLEAYRILYRAGSDCIPQIRTLLSDIDWKKFDHGYHTRYVAGFVSLIHDIDEAESARTVHELQSAGCGRAISRVLDVITRDSKKDYKQFDAHGVALRIHNTVPSREQVAKLFTAWLRNVPTCDLDAIEQVVVTSDGPNDIRGDYAPYLCSVRVIWRAQLPEIPGLRWLSRLFIEKTLYHEVGHHVHQHTFGQDPEQEAEANQYASRLMRLAHPVINLFIGTPIRVIRRLGRRARADT
jgi:hypothetical protein